MSQIDTEYRKMLEKIMLINNVKRALNDFHFVILAPNDKYDHIPSDDRCWVGVINADILAIRRHKDSQFEDYMTNITKDAFQRAFRAVINKYIDKLLDEALEVFIAETITEKEKTISNLNNILVAIESLDIRKGGGNNETIRN